MAEDLPAEIVFTDPTSASIEYGQSWSFPLRGDYMTQWFLSNPENHPGALEISGAPVGYKPGVFIQGSGAATGALYSNYDTRPLNAGTYSFTITVDAMYFDAHYLGATPTPAVLTITPAKLGTEVRVVPDPSNPANAIISARLTGRFVEEHSSSEFEGSPLSPAGSWSITLTDSTGAKALERTVDRVAGDDTLATSIYWDEAEPGEQYTASATFTPSATPANFEVTPAIDFDYTAADTLREIAESDAAEQSAADLPPEPDFSVPLWWVILIGVAISTLIAFAIVFATRLARLPARPAAPTGAATGEVS